jgi:hypothetical protein
LISYKIILFLLLVGKIQQKQQQQLLYQLVQQNQYQQLGNNTGPNLMMEVAGMLLLNYINK